MAGEDYDKYFSGLDAGAGDAEEDEGVGRPRGMYYGVPDSWLAKVGQDYADRVPLPTPGSAADFRYAESGGPTPDLYKTSDDVDRKVLLSLPPERLRDLQEAMARTGLYGAKPRYVGGFMDENTRKGFVKLLGYANTYGDTWDSTLQKMLESGGTFGSEGIDGSGGGGGAIRQGRIQTVSSAVTLEEQVQQSARQRLGRKLKPSEVSRFVSIYQGLERGVNSQELAAAETADMGGNSTLTQAPGPDAAASQYLDANFATEEASQDSLGYLSALEQMLGT